MITVPPAFASAIVAREGDAVRAWLAALPDTVAGLCRRWNLRVEGLLRHGHLAVVVPVRRGAEP